MSVSEPNMEEMQMILTRKLMLPLCFLVNAIGCAPGFQEEKPRFEDGPSSIHSSSLENFVSARVQPTPEPEKYIVYFSWPRIEDHKTIRVRLSQTLAEVQPSQTDFNHEVSHDQTLTYNFEVLDSAHKIEKVFPKKVKIPRDFVVREGQMEFKEDLRLNVNRIFLSSAVPLRTNGHRIEIVANELKSEGGVIESFEEGAKAEPDTIGRSAGELTLNIGSASGSLKINMRGEIGGDGSKGPSHSTRAATGTPATDGSENCRCVGPNCHIKYGGPTLSSINLKPQMEVCTCSYGHNGGQGAHGAKGHKGLPAKNGGDSGLLKVSVLDGREFDLQAYSIPGEPGKPGEGGDGQLGGLGGPGNDGSPHNCRGFTGPEGPQGPMGDPGDPAQAGEKGLACIYIASEGKNDCF